MNDILNDLLKDGIIDSSKINSINEMIRKNQLLNDCRYKIYQTKDGYWNVFLPSNEGKRKHWKRKSKGEIEEIVIEYQKRNEDNPTIEEIFKEWNNDSVEKEFIKPTTACRNESIFNRHFSEFGKKRIKDITLEEWVTFLEDQIPLFSLTAHAFAGVKGITKGILQRARRKKYISFTAQDVINELILPKNAFTRIVRRDEDEVYTDEEMSLIMQYCTENRDTWGDCIKLIFITGLRIGEATSIKHEDIDINNLCIHVYKTESRYRDENGMVRTYVGETTKTDAGFRKVYIPKQFEKFLRSLWERSANTTWVFEYNGRRVHTNAIRKKLKRICEAVEVPYKSPHKIRKTFCSILLDNNINQSFIKAQMGHTDISTSEMYYHRDRVNSKKKVETLSAIEEFSMV